MGGDGNIPATYRKRHSAIGRGALGCGLHRLQYEQPELRGIGSKSDGTRQFRQWLWRIVLDVSEVSGVSAFQRRRAAGLRAGLGIKNLCM